MLTFASLLSPTEVLPGPHADWLGDSGSTVKATLSFETSPEEQRTFSS